MKKLLVALAAIICATSMMVQAQESTNSAPAPKKHKLTATQQKVMDEMLAKYDTNHDGKLDKTERSAMSADDKQKMIDAGLGKAPKKPKTDSGDASAPAKQN